MVIARQIRLYLGSTLLLAFSFGAGPLALVQPSALPTASSWQAGAPPQIADLASKAFKVGAGLLLGVFEMAANWRFRTPRTLAFKRNKFWSTRRLFLWYGRLRLGDCCQLFGPFAGSGKPKV